MSYIQQWREDRKHPMTHPVPQYPAGAAPVPTAPALAPQMSASAHSQAQMGLLAGPADATLMAPNPLARPSLPGPASVATPGSTHSAQGKLGGKNNAANIKIGRPRKGDDPKPPKKGKGKTLDADSPAEMTVAKKPPKLTKKQQKAQAEQLASLVQASNRIPVVQPAFNPSHGIAIQPVPLPMQALKPPEMTNDLAVGVGLGNLNMLPGLQGGSWNAWS